MGGLADGRPPRAVRAAGRRPHLVGPARGARGPGAASAVAKARGWAQVHPYGLIDVNSLQRGTPAEWTWVFAHCLLHLGFGHLEGEGPVDRAYAAACCVAVTRFQTMLRLGEARSGYPRSCRPYPRKCSRLAGARRTAGIRRVGRRGAVADLASRRPRGRWCHTCRGVTGCRSASRPPPRRPSRRPVGCATNAPGRRTPTRRGNGPGAGSSRRFAWRRWRRLHHRVRAGAGAAAADLGGGGRCEVAEIYINPLAGPTRPGGGSCAHEMLHAALRHGDRVGGRDAYLWNVAADYVINGWLIEMGVGSARRAAARPGASGAVGRGGLRPDRPRPAPAAPPRHAARAGLGDILADPVRPRPAARSAWTSSTAGR